MNGQESESVRKMEDLREHEEKVKAVKKVREIFEETKKQGERHWEFLRKKVRTRVLTKHIRFAAESMGDRNKMITNLEKYVGTYKDREKD